MTPYKKLRKGVWETENWAVCPRQPSNPMVGFENHCATGSLFDIKRLAGFDGGDFVGLGLDVVGAEGKARGDLQHAVWCAIGLARDGDAGLLEPMGRPLDHHPARHLGAVGAGGVFDGGELFGAESLQNDRMLGHRQGVKDEGFQFDTVGCCGLDGVAGRVNAWNLLDGAMEGQGKVVALIQFFDERDVNQMDADRSQLEDQ